MTGNCQTALISTVLAGLIVVALPAAAQQVPIPTPAPQPRSGQVPPPPSSVPSARPGAQAQQAAPVPAPTPAPSGGSSWLPSFLGGAPSAPPKARPHRGVRRPAAGAGGQGQRLSVPGACDVRLVRADRRRRPPRQRQFLCAEAGQGPLRIRSAEPDRHHCRRLIGGGARPQAGDPGPLSRCRRRRCASCWPTRSTSCATPMSRR